MKKANTPKFETPEQKVQRITKNVISDLQKQIITANMDNAELILRIDELEDKLQHLERKFINSSGTTEFDVFDGLNNTPTTKVELQEGVEYLSKIVSGELTKRFYYEKADKYMNAYVVELENVEGKFQINLFVDNEQLKINQHIRFFVQGRSIKNFNLI